MTSPPPISKRALQGRVARVRRIAKAVGFVGHVDYIHAYSRTGGGQYVQGVEESSDRLHIYAEAMDRDASDDFSLEAVIAHERGHQLAARHPSLSSSAALSDLAAEVVASLLGAKIVNEPVARGQLLAKAAGELLLAGVGVEEVERMIAELWTLFEELLCSDERR